MNNLKDRLRGLSRRCRRDQGQSAFEFMLMLPIFMLFVLLVIDFAILGFSYVSVANAAREGARYGAVNCGGSTCSEALIDARVLERSSGMVSDASNVDVSWPEGTGRGDPIAVSIDQTYNFLFFPFTVPVQSCSEMRLEQADSGATSGGSGC